MTQEIEIGVRANTGGAEAGMDRLSAKAAQAGEAVNKLGKFADEFAAGMKRAAEAAGRVNTTKRILERETGKTISAADAEKFLKNFEQFRGGRGLGSQRVRAYRSFEDWYQGHVTSFKSQPDAARHRRHIISIGLQGTSYAREYGEPEQEPEPNPHPEKPGAFSNGVQRAQSMAMAFSRSMLALAGVGGIAAMAAKGADMATEESTGIDTLVRRGGDEMLNRRTNSLAESFDRLEQQTRAATAGMGLTYVESARLAQEYVHTTGTLHGVDLRSGLNTGVAMSRRLGIDPSLGTQFMATMQLRRVVDGSDQANRKLAGLIADAIKKGGYPGKGEEILQAVADFTNMAARQGLATPNVRAYASEFSALTDPTKPGRSPEDVGALLGTVDANIRRGGAYGEASLNFTYRAINHEFGQVVDPVAAKALWQGGAFATTRQVFGQGGPLAGMKGAPPLTDKTVFAMERAELQREYASKNSTVRNLSIEAAANQWGVTEAQAGLLLNTGPRSLSEKDAEKALKSYQDHPTEGSQIRQSIVNLQNELTRIGNPINQSLNFIRETVEAIAQSVAPEQYKRVEQDRKNRSTDFHKQYEAGIPGPLGTTLGGNKADERAAAYLSKKFDASVRGGSPLSLDDLKAYPTGFDPNGTAGDRAGFAYANSVRQMVLSHMYSMGYGPDGKPLPQGTQRTARIKQAMAEWQALGWSKGDASVLTGTGLWEGQGLNPAARGDFDRTTGQYTAMGIMQWRKQRVSEFERVSNQLFGHHETLASASLNDQIKFADYELRLGKFKSVGNQLRAARDLQSKMQILTGGYERPKGGDTDRLKERLNLANEAYASDGDTRPGRTPIPGGKHAAAADRQHQHHVKFHPATVHLADPNTGEHKASVTLVPFMGAGAAGTAGTALPEFY